MKKDKKDMDTTDQHGRSGTMKATTLTPTTDPDTITMTGYRQARWTPGWTTGITIRF